MSSVVALQNAEVNNYYQREQGQKHSSIFYAAFALVVEADEVCLLRENVTW